MSELLQRLPGLSMAIPDVTDTLRHMWDGMSEHGESHISDFRASQMNLILHFGLRTEVEDGLRCFDSAIRFAQRYPCRIVVLCPERSEGSDRVLESKLFSQCYIGENRREMCCCEALMLGYHINASSFLENQVSLWLESDLPVYHWFHKVSPERIERQYLSFLQRSNRVILDSAVDPDIFRLVPWPRPDRVSDLAKARTLPLRQNLGQFLSGFSPEALTAELSAVVVRHSESNRGEGMHLLEWQRSCVDRALSDLKLNNAVRYDLDPSEEGGVDSLVVEWIYRKQSRYLVWSYNARSRTGNVSCKINGNRLEHPFYIEPISPELALSEALFF